MDEDEPTQETDRGYEIPIPTKGTWDKLLERIARGGGANGADHKRGDR